ncbi:MAG: hypothetical protein EOM80_16945 [Erysipelotrichia bacterium]|nr:hypothetical protein [Erysipelotrichia bacterium]
MLNNDYKEMLQILLEEEVDFIVVGAYALAAHGVPRATGDIDIWIKTDTINAERLIRALKKFGAPVGDITASDFTEPDIVFQIGVAPRRIDFLTSIDGVNFADAEKDKLTIKINDIDIPVISLENLIKNKKAASRPKDLLDIESLKNK